MDYFKVIKYSGLKFLEKIRKSLEDLSIEIKKNNLVLNTSYSLTLSDFVTSSKRHYINFEQFLSKMTKEIIEPTDIQIANYNKETNNLLLELSKINSILQENKLKVEKFKHNYFNASKESMEHEQKVIKYVEGSNVKQDNIKSLHEQLAKYQKICDSHEQVYKSELLKMNKTLEENEPKYEEIILSLKNQEINKLNCIINGFNKYYNFRNDYMKNENDYIKRIEKIKGEIDSKKDIEKYDNSMNFLKDNHKRFLNEQFLNYEVFKKNLEKKNNQDNNNSEMLKIINKDSKILGFETFTSFDSFEIKRLKVEKLNIEKDSKLEELVEKMLKSKEILSKEEKEYIVKLFESDSKMARYFMKIVSNYYEDNMFLKLMSLENLEHFSDILISILDKSKNNKEIFDLSFIIIYISEKTIYFNPDNLFNKRYLCKLLSENNIFTRDFWTNLINYKIETVAKLKVNVEVEKNEKETNVGNSTLMSGMSFFKNIKQMINKSKIQENKKIESEILYSQIYEEKLPTFAVEVLQDYIIHFTNFNFDINESMQLIAELSLKYKFDNAYVTYFMAELNSNMFTISNRLDEIEKKVDYTALYFNKKMKLNKIQDIKIKSIIYSMKYLNLKEMIPILTLNKFSNEKIKKTLYKNILLKYHNMDIKTHINIWKILLNLPKIKKKFNYQKIKEEMEKNPNSIPAKDIILLDVQRTSFLEDKDQNREKVANILKAISKESPNITYCQGMNYIAAFLLMITDDEEESFYIFLALLFYTSYGALFKDDLEKLKKYFYVFERLINILLPELYFYFKNNNINVNFFISPWFITLFTCAYPYVSDMKNPKILLRIWDLFIFNGWKSIIKIGLSLIKHFESKLLSLTFENLLHFLITDIIKSEFFSNQNFDKLMFITINFKIKGELISNIENEYEMKRKITQNSNHKEK